MLNPIKWWWSKRFAGDTAWKDGNTVGRIKYRIKLWYRLFKWLAIIGFCYWWGATSGEWLRNLLEKL